MFVLYAPRYIPDTKIKTVSFSSEKHIKLFLILCVSLPVPFAICRHVFIWCLRIVFRTYTGRAFFSVDLFSLPWLSQSVIYSKVKCFRINNFTYSSKPIRSASIASQWPKLKKTLPLLLLSFSLDSTCSLNLDFTYVKWELFASISVQLFPPQFRFRPLFPSGIEIERSAMKWMSCLPSSCENFQTKTVVTGEREKP